MCTRYSVNSPLHCYLFLNKKQVCKPSQHRSHHKTPRMQPLLLLLTTIELNWLRVGSASVFRSTPTVIDKPNIDLYQSMVFGFIRRWSVGVCCRYLLFFIHWLRFYFTSTNGQIVFYRPSCRTQIEKVLNSNSGDYWEINWEWLCCNAKAREVGGCSAGSLKFGCVSFRNEWGSVKQTFCHLTALLSSIISALMEQWATTWCFTQLKYRCLTMCCSISNQQWSWAGHHGRHQYWNRCCAW